VTGPPQTGPPQTGPPQTGQPENGDAAAAPGPVRIAMWSGPRTVSTALMRSFENRPDTVVVDEPLYAYYLARTGVDHPGRDEIIASMPTDWRTVLTELATAPLPAGASVYYQKHMTHHLLEDVDRGALAGLRHAFLIRDPRRLLTSYARVRSRPVLADLGLEQQVEIFRTFGGPVIDSADILHAPGPALAALCDALGIAFHPAMLSWPAGSRPTDGIWARHWYDSVWRSTGFGAGGQAAAVDLPPDLAPLAAQCQPFYDELAAHKLRP